MDNFKRDLFNINQRLKDEIIENITTLNQSDREFYLNRISIRINGISENANIQKVDSCFEMIIRCKCELNNFISKLIEPFTESHIPNPQQDKKLSDKPSPSENENKTTKLKDELTKYGFFDIELVKSLSDKNKEKLLNLINSNVLPYCIAMFDNLGFLTELSKSIKVKYKLHKEISRWFDAEPSGRSIRGYINVLNDGTSEDTSIYTTLKYKDQVKEDFSKLK